MGLTTPRPPADGPEVIPDSLEVELPARGEAAPRARPLAEHMRLRDLLYRRALAVSDGLVALLVLAFVVGLREETMLRWPALLAPLVVIGVGKVSDLYDQDAMALRRSTIDEVPKLFVTTALVAMGFWLAGDLVVRGELSRTQVLALWALGFVGLFAGRVVARAFVRRAFTTERCMLVGSREALARLQLSMSLRPGLELVDYFPLRSRAGGRFEPLGSALRSAGPRLQQVVERDGIHRVIVAISGTDEFDENVLDGIYALEHLGLKVSVVPHMLEVIGSAGEVEDLDGLPVLGIRPFGLPRSSRLIKRAFDLLVGGIALTLLAPVMLVVALAVRRSSPGPVVYRQRRIGRHGAEFEMLKFRTMVDGAEDLRGALAAQNETTGVFKLGEDPRVTPLGRFLRRASLDELPQLWNVMRGSMSLVGPRPLVPDEDDAIQGWRRRRLELAPGMTGPWQVLGSTRVPLNEMVKMDYLYIANWSPWADVRALLLTLPHVFGRRGL